VFSFKYSEGQYHPGQQWKEKDYLLAVLSVMKSAE
jgi:hypothetical protein